MGLRVSLLLLVLIGSATPAWAQGATSGSIAGVARDTSGGVLPGVTVEAASPALIEKVRTAVTDDQGRYQIVELRPGTYTVTFSLTGFSTVRHENIELTTGFTATVNGDLRVGSLAETITVTGSSPTVDTHSTRTQNVLTRDALDALPSGKTVQAYGALTLGAVATPDVGGNKGEAPVGIGIRGVTGGDMRQQVDGMNINITFSTGGGGLRFFMVNSSLAQEVTLQTGGSAEAETGGVQMNLVPKEGGNVFRYNVASSYTNSGLQTNNFTDELENRGLASGPSVRSIYDYGFGIGGPVKQDKLWFYTGHRWWGSAEDQPGAFFNKTPESLFYVADLDRPAFTDLYNQDHNVRLTWQAAQKHKVNGFFSLQANCNCYAGVSSSRAPEASSMADFWPTSITQATWSYPATNRLLLEAGGMYGEFGRRSRAPDEQAPNTIAAQDLTSGFFWGSQLGTLANDYGLNDGTNYNGRASATYVTGSHAFKTGLFWQAGRGVLHFQVNDPPVRYQFRNCFTTGCTPAAVTYVAAPHYSKALVRNYGLYAQDQWTIRRLTLNLGLRFDYLHSWNPAQTRPAGRFVGEFQFDKLDNVPLWKDLNPRFGAAYDVFGNGKTAIKVFLGRYVQGEGTSIAQANNPASAIVTTADRVWSNDDGDFVPEENELAALNNQFFGTVRVNTTWAKDVLEGWGLRGYNWQGSATVQHELRPGMGLNAAYFRTSFGNFRVTDNLNQAPANFDTYCVTAPLDQRLPGGGGNQICGLYDLQRPFFGVATAGNLVRAASNFGEQTNVYNGFEISLSSRFGRGGMLSGGVSSGKQVTDDCAIVQDSPQKQFCRQVQGWNAQTQVKLNGSYPLPYDFQVSGVLQNLPGVPQTATRSYANAEIAPSLGRNLSSCPSPTGACGATASVLVLEPFTQFEKRLNQFDFRLTKLFNFGGTRVQGMFDIYNMFNANTILGVNGAYGNAWLRPTAILGGRLFKFGAQVDF